MDAAFRVSPTVFIAQQDIGTGENLTRPYYLGTLNGLKYCNRDKNTAMC
jgi:hypothetical protein